MTLNIAVELVVLLISIALVVLIVRRSNRKVADLDGLGDVVQADVKKGNIVAYL